MNLTQEIRNQVVDEYMEENETAAERKERIKWEKLKDKYIERRLKGETIQKISDSLQVLESQCLEWEEDLKNESIIFRKITIEKTINENKLRKSDRVKNLSSLLNRINKEIANRDFSDVPTDKLILLGSKLNETLEQIINKENNEFIGSSITRINVD